MTPLDMAHEIMKFAALDHARDLKISYLTPSKHPDLAQRQANLYNNLGQLDQVTGAYTRLAGIIEEARLPADASISVHPSRYLALAKNVDGYLQELGFKSMEKKLFDAFTKARKEARTPGF